MELVKTTIDVKHNGTKILSWNFHMPEYGEDEFKNLQYDWKSKFGTDSNAMIINNAAATDKYYWLLSNAWITLAKVPYYNNNYDGIMLGVMRQLFQPCFDESVNNYALLTAIPPDRESGEQMSGGIYVYWEYDVELYSGTTKICDATLLTLNPNYTRNDYPSSITCNIKNVPSGYGASNVVAEMFFGPSYVEPGSFQVFYRIRGKNGQIGVGIMMFWIRNNGNKLEMYFCPFASDQTTFPFNTNTPLDSPYDYLRVFLSNVSDVSNPTDPYSGGGTSGDDAGGDTDFDDSSDTITDSSLPTLSAADTGFTRIYNPTLTQVQNLANYLWTDPSIISTLWNHVKQFLENPMDAFIAFNLVPCTVPDGGTAEFKVMYIGTGVSLTTAANQFVDVDCGNVQIAKMYDSALDYSPYTRVSMFLPYIGSVELNCDEVMGKTLSVTYRIDIVSGGCVAKIAVDGSIRYQYSGHCAITIPFTSADFTGYVSAMIQASKTVASLAAGAAGMPDLAATIAGVPGQKSGETITTTTRALNPKTGRLRNVAQDIEEHSGTKASFTSLMKSGVGNTVGAVIGSKPLVERTGSFSGNTGYLGVRRPYVIIERPRMCNPEQYGKYNGRPAMIYEKLGNLTGYTVVQEVQLTGFSATNPELDEIGSFLKGGVIL